MPSPTTHQPRISLIAGIILIVVTLLTGVAVFVVMQRNAEALLSKSLQLSLQNRVQLTHTEIRAGFERTVLISTRPLLIDQLQFVDARANGTTPHSFAAAHGLFVDARADGTATQNKLNMAVGSLLENELTAVAFYGKDGQELARAGVFTQQPELVVPLNNFPGSVQLLWDGQLFLRAVVEMKKEGRVIGKVMTETSLSVTRGALKDASLLGETGELVLCAPFSLNMQCFPSTRLPNVLTRSQHSARGDPLPMAHALAGETGFVTARDYRDQEVVAAYAPVGDFGLGMVLKMDSAELYAPVWMQLRYLIPLLAGVLVLALLLLRWRLTPLVLRLVLSEAQAREMSASLRDSEMMSRAITENMAEGLITTTTDDIVVDANAAVLRIFGYEKSELIGRDVSELAPERHRRQYKDTTAALGAQPEAFRIPGREVRSLRKDGSEFTASMSFADVQVGGRRLFTALILDITERKRAEAELLRFKNVLDSTLDMIFMFEPASLRFVYLNQGAVLSMGYSREELLGMTPYQIKPLIPESQFRQIIAPLLSGEQSSLRFETLHRRKDGTDFPIAVFLQLVTQSDGSRLFVAIVDDITERKKAETEQKTQQLELATQASQMKDEIKQRVAVQDQLQISHGHLREAQALAKIGSWGYDLSDQQIEWSDQMYDLFPQSREDGPPSFESHYSSIHPEDRELWTNTVEACLKTGEKYKMRFRATFPDKVIWIEAIGQGTRAKDGQIVGLYGTCQDVTDSVKSEELLRQSEEQFRKQSQHLSEIIWGTDIATWEWNVQTGETVFNTRWAEIVGYTLDELAPISINTWSKLVHPDDGKRSGELLTQCFNRESDTYICEARMRHKNGEWVWVLDRGRVVEWTEDGKPLRMSGTHQDITERKRAVAEILRFKNVLDNTLDMIFMFEPASLRFVYLNQGAILSMGYSAEELLGMTPYQIKPLFPEPEFRQLIAPLLSGEQSSLRFETLHRRKDGTDFPVDIFLQLVTQSNGSGLFINIVRDITERKQAENEILRAKVAVAVADHANVAKSAFLANMSHEIRTPMNSIMGMALLALKTELSPKQRDYIAKIQYSSRHLLGIINDILDFSKIEANQLVLETLDFDLPTMVRDISSQLGDSATAKGLGLVCDIDPQLSQPLRGDPLRLRQILLNYIDNAIKFTHQGKIIVSARILEETAGDRLVRFEVQDTGIGMSEAEVADLFRAFHQADASTTRTYGGTGLGLAISKQLAALMGGEVGVESRPAQGSTFWFTARLGRGTDQAAMAQEARPPVDLSLIKGAAVLLVEDNLFNQQVARELLEEAGAAVTLADNGQEAIDWLLQAHCDCVLMDIQMPVMDGLEATRQIRANPALSSTPVIGLTANAGQEDQAHCFQAGMNDVVSKPFEPDRLLAVLATWLAQQPGQSQPAHAASTAAARPLPPVAVSEAAAGDASVIDLAVLANIVSPNPEKIRKYALMFVSSTHDTLAEVEATLAHADMVGVAALGHRAKSSARMVGAMGFADLCQALEQCTQAGDYDKACGIVAQMQPLLARISEQIDKEFNE